MESTAIVSSPAAPLADEYVSGNALTSRNFIGLLIAQFLAAFNDQAIHAAAMFFAINTRTLSEENAITLMPVLFYAPWAIFSTVAGYLADRYSKRTALVTWKFAEVGITAVAALGFWLGRNHDPSLGTWIVLAAVFLMGTHSAFFVPAKYGVMPEILPVHQLSRGNGMLESLSFLAVILGTVSGGVLSYLFLRNEVAIGVILFVLAIIGAASSLMIRKMPASAPDRKFPKYIYGPLVANIRTLVSIPALRLVLIGLVFFTFVVAFMRAAVYMLGESQNPRWDELKTSLIVGTVALGIGLGSPLAGWVSGRRIELRLVVIGALGMVLSLLAAAYYIHHIPILVGCIITIGFCTGFYIVPLFTLLQHRAPKGNKGDLIATSNAVNTVGAIAATLLFKLVVVFAHTSGITPEVTDMTRVQSGNLTRLSLEHGRPVGFTVFTDSRETMTIGRERHEKPWTLRRLKDHVLRGPTPGETIMVDRDVPISEVMKGDPVPVDVHRFTVSNVVHFELTPRGKEPHTHYDNRQLPRYLFLGAALMTLGMLLTINRPLTRVRQEGF